MVRCCLLFSTEISSVTELASFVGQPQGVCEETSFCDKPLREWEHSRQNLEASSNTFYREALSRVFLVCWLQSLLMVSAHV